MINLLKNYLFEVKAKLILKSYVVKRPCLKMNVRAALLTPSGKVILGSNEINSNVFTCPRAEAGCSTGEGYELCKTICKQISHAEVSAINKTKTQGHKIEGSKMYLLGHSFCCNSCLEYAKKCGVKEINVIESNITYLL